MKNLIDKYRNSGLSLNGEDFQNYLSGAIVGSMLIDGFRVGLIEFKVLMNTGIAINGLSQVEKESAVNIGECYRRIVDNVRAGKDISPMEVATFAGIISGGNENYNQVPMPRQIVYGNVCLRDAAYEAALKGMGEGADDKLSDSEQRDNKLTCLCSYINEHLHEIDKDDCEAQYRLSTNVHTAVVNNLFWGEATGRMARLLMHWIQLYFQLPLVRFEADRFDDYINAVGRSATAHNSDALYSLVLDEVKRQTEGDISVLEAKATTGRRGRRPRPRIENKNDAQEAILQAFSKDSKLTARKVSARLGIPVYAVMQAMSTLKKSGRLVRVGSKKSGHWEVKKS